MMGTLGDRLIVDGSRYRLRSDGRAVSDLIGQLESGELPAAAVASGAITPADVVAALAHEALGDEDSLGLPLVQAAPPRPRLARALAEPAWAEVFPRTSRPSRLAMAAGLLQVFDFWDASHEAAQQADDLGEGDYSAYWHGIAHRREPDPGNAAYWFRRVGRHPLFPPLADAARRDGLAAALGRLERDGHDRPLHPGEARHAPRGPRPTPPAARDVAVARGHLRQADDLIVGATEDDFPAPMAMHPPLLASRIPVRSNSSPARAPYPRRARSPRPPSSGPRSRIRPRRIRGGNPSEDA
jgi:hypothetical protein